MAELTLLGSPLTADGLQAFLSDKEEKVKLMCDRIEQLDSHWGLFFLSRFASASRLNYLLRSAPAYQCIDALNRIDNIVRNSLAHTTNVDVSEMIWAQASLPVRFGGIGVRCVSTLALPCYVASLICSLPLMRVIARR